MLLLFHLQNGDAPSCKCPYSFRNSTCSRANMNGIIWCSLREAKPSISNCGQSLLTFLFVCLFFGNYVV